MHLGAEIARETIDLIASKLPEGDLTGVDFTYILEEISVPQGHEDKVLYAAPKIFKETCVINWNQSAKTVYDFVRGLSPYPGTWSELYSESSNIKPIVIKILRQLRQNSLLWML